MPHPKANWQGQVAHEAPLQSTKDLPKPWVYKEFSINPRATYALKAVVLSKHSYWAGSKEDTLAPFDVALGWGQMSNAAIINQLTFTQSGRWYNYRWRHNPPIDVNDIIRHSSNHHLIPANRDILKAIKNIKTHDIIELKGYLVDIQSTKENWYWHTSLSRDDSRGGSCEVFWVTHINPVK